MELDEYSVIHFNGRNIVGKHFARHNSICWSELLKIITVEIALNNAR